MPPLPSGLPEWVDDDEVVSRFLTQSSHFNSVGAKPAAFLPNPKYRNTSVFRIGGEPDRLRRTWDGVAGPGRSLKGAAQLQVQVARACSLDVVAEEPPPAHANLEGWPWIDPDPELQKARQLEIAVQLAKAAEVIRL